MNIKTIALIFTAVCATACYEDYVKDYEYSTIYNAFQYDLRSFVVGEGMKFDYTVGLTGVIDNSRNRAVTVECDDNLVTADLPSYLGVEGSAFTALQGMLGTAKFGALSQSYVTNEVKALGISALTPLPKEYYSLDGLDNLRIRRGRGTAAVTVRADEAFLADPKAVAPYYALGFHIVEADADKVFPEKSFEVIAVKCECMYFGNWYYGGKSTTLDKISGKVLSEDSYPLVLPQQDSKVYSLKTVGPYSVVTDKIAGRNGQCRLDFEGGKVTMSCSDPSVTPGDCYSNEARLIQDREIRLNYSIDNGDGTVTFYNDILCFRNRIRDGVNEWQDENPENYK